MKLLICQPWKVFDSRSLEGTYSLHLNEMHRMHFLRKNLPKNSQNIEIRNSYTCKVKDDVYEKIIENQAKHGVMFDGKLPLRKLERLEGSYVENYFNSIKEDM